MKEFNIQLQPERLQLSNTQEVVSGLEKELDCLSGVQDVGVDYGEDSGAYINFHFGANDASSLWPVIRELLCRSELEAGVIVTCEGDSGWDDYLLLHHFDASESCDGF